MDDQRRRLEYQRRMNAALRWLRVAQADVERIRAMANADPAASDGELAKRAHDVFEEAANAAASALAAQHVALRLRLPAEIEQHVAQASRFRLVRGGEDDERAT